MDIRGARLVIRHEGYFPVVDNVKTAKAHDVRFLNRRGRRCGTSLAVCTRHLQDNLESGSLKSGSITCAGIFKTSEVCHSLSQSSFSQSLCLSVSLCRPSIYSVLFVAWPLADATTQRDRKHSTTRRRSGPRGCL